MMLTRNMKGHLRLLVVAVLMIVCNLTDCHATGLFSGADVEKPTPQFTWEDDRLSAKFIPRAKSTSVRVEFQVTAGGTLDGVKGLDFYTIDRPEVGIKNFKSAAFEIDVRDVAPGAMATVALRSDFFSMSTAFYVFNPALAVPWIKDAQKENRLTNGRIRELIIEVKDGGDRDADGATNGRIRLVGGPRDSFWGYALGTLFIRFFGIFFVLSMLMIGMFVSGWVFTVVDRSRKRKASPHPDCSPILAYAVAAADVSQSTGAVPGSVVAAIGTALYLRNHAKRKTTFPANVMAQAEQGSAWSQAGRWRIMQERLGVFGQAGKNRN